MESPRRVDIALTRKRDDLYADQRDEIEPFRFDHSVVGVFSDMIDRSVPGYGLLLEMIAVITERYAQPQSRCYDLGCSLGDSTLAIASGLTKRFADQPGEAGRIISVDNSHEMLAACRENLQQQGASAGIDLVCQDLRDTAIIDAGIVVMNFTLQFISPPDRPGVMQRIASGMRPGGALLLSEKVTSIDSSEEQLHVALHEAFKQARGYSELEIAQKRTAIENVLVPESVETHCARILDAGFSECALWFRCANFVSVLAIR